MNNCTNIEQYLKENGSLTYTFRGTSMNPLLKQGRDMFTVVSKTSDRCRKYDVVLYRNTANRYVLHRVIAVRDDDYVIQGDNCIFKEYGIHDEDIIGVMSAFMHKEKTYAVTDRRYLLYVYIWTALHPLLSVFKRIKARVRRHLR